MALLEHDPDKHYLLNGITNGFDIINQGYPEGPIQVANYSSALQSRKLVEKQLQQELDEGRYLIVKDPPRVISALGAIPKPDGTVRLIHDCSRPQGNSVNDYAVISSNIKYQTVQDAVNLISKGYYLAKLDLQSAYRYVSTNSAHWPYAGLQWTFEGHSKPTYMVDTRLPFGARLSVEAFHRISLALQRILLNQGIQTVIYLDDILIISKSEKECSQHMGAAVSTLRSLGLAISYNKMEGPTQKLTFLGIEINTATCTLGLPADKLRNFSALLEHFLQQQRASLKQLQRLVGKLAWASHVVTGGRIFLQRVLDTMRPLKHASHKVKLSLEFKLDIQWWLQYMPLFNNTSFCPQQRPFNIITTDSSSQAGGATLNSTDWFYLDWIIDHPAVFPLHINAKEALMAFAALYRWAPTLRDSSVILYTDNVFTQAAINKGACSNPIIVFHIRNLFWLCNLFNFTVKCRHIPGKDNIASDSISRLRTCGHFLYWNSVVTGNAFNSDYFITAMEQHMSNNCISFFLTQVPNLVPWLTASIKRLHITGH